MLLFRTATRQIVRRMGYLASFMCRPKVKGLYSSGWHLHQSLVDTKPVPNAFMPTNAGEPLSKLGKAYLGGLLNHAVPATVFANPTINAYRRFRANSLAPDRLAWGTDHRGVMLRVLGEARRPGSPHREPARENPPPIPISILPRKSSPASMELIIRVDPGAPDTDPYSADRTMLPKSLPLALDSLAHSALCFAGKWATCL